MTERSQILEQVVTDLLSIPPLIFREIRRKLVRTVLIDIDAGITAHHLEIMRLLQREGKLHAAEIGDRLQIARAQMTRLIDKLVCLDLAERQTDPTDRRSTIITLSAYGETVLKEHNAAVMKAIEEVRGQLPDEDLRDLSETLRKLQAILSRLG